MKCYLFIITVLFLFFSCQNEQGDSASDQDLPNVVWLVTEDNSKHFLKLYDESGAPMPNVEALVKKGIVFNNAFSNAPVCSVARSTIIAGCYAPRVGVQYHRKMREVPLPDGLEMFPAYLQRAGYYTSNNDKEDYNFSKPKGTWNESSKNASYRNRAKGQPFFHVQNFKTTHESKLQFSKAAMMETKLTAKVEDIKPFPYHPDTPLFRYTYATYHDLHQKVDQEIGVFLRQLEADSLMDNTIIFYYGDHGGVLPRSKGYVYESGLHVPLVVYIPEKYQSLCPVKKGSRTDAFVEFVDFAPTVLNLAGIPVPEQMDGSPFLGKNIKEGDYQDRNTSFGYADRFDEKFDLVRSYRKDNFKYIRNYQPFNVDGLFNFYRYKNLALQEWASLYRAGRLNANQQQFFRARQSEALYDLNADPHEINNLAGDPAYQDQLTAMRADLRNQVKFMPDLSFFPEPYFLENGMDNPVAFGQAHKSAIGKLVDIADLSLSPFTESKDKLAAALRSEDPWQRYWGWITCSAYGETARSFFPLAAEAVSSDSENLVRLRALEFLMLNNQSPDQKDLLEIIKNAKTESEANLILNSVALFKQTLSDFKIEIPETDFNPEWIDGENDLVRERLKYLVE